MTRRELREHVFRILFACEFCRKKDEASGRKDWPDAGSVEEQIRLYFTHPGGDDVDFPPCEVDPEDQETIRGRVHLIAEKVPEIDRLLDETSTGWKTSRMTKPDLTILRVAAYEMLCDDQIPTGVAINEAVLLAKKFGGDDSSSFVNGILAKMERQRNT